MSEVHDQAVNLLAIPQLGTYLTPEGREMVLRALDEQEKELAALRANADKALCVYCGHIGPKTREAMSDHMLECEKRPENQLLDAAIAWQERAEKAEAQLAAIRDALNSSPAVPTSSATPPGGAPTEPAGDFETHEDPGGHGQQVAAADGVQPDKEAAPAGAQEQNENREAGAGRLAGIGSAEGGPPTPAAAANDDSPLWGRVDEKGAWHLWRRCEHGLVGEAECGEATDAEIEVLERNEKPPVDQACLDCAALAGWDEPEKALQRANHADDGQVDKEPELPGTTENALRACAGQNKSAGTICGSSAVAMKRDGKWFCKRHDPEKSKTCLVPGCGAPGRTAKGSPGIWCKEHAAKLSEAERRSIAERQRRLQESAA